ncbi:hypothetical protein ACH5RR_020823 [Cinchona calisaya]|uniref:Yippee domain-containing protein n=1 Tax=Cinchona calisaya TaxID=153742 RepID=A0ABD2ZFJ8_9GENT
MARTRPLIVELDEGENLYICRNCYTHIGYAGLLTHIDFSPQGSGLTGDKFQEVVNVRGHSRTRRDVGFYTIKDVHCRNCIDHLGWEFVEIRGGRLHHNRENVHKNALALRNAGPRTVKDIHCIKCCDLLGREFVEVAADVEENVYLGEFLLMPMYKDVVLSVIVVKRRKCFPRVQVLFSGSDI